MGFLAASWALPDGFMEPLRSPGDITDHFRTENLQFLTAVEIQILRPSRGAPGAPPVGLLGSWSSRDPKWSQSSKNLTKKGAQWAKKGGPWIKKGAPWTKSGTPWTKKGGQ